eukprot:CAMPEP_0182901872 /NCGR_PEP_ID=MMETSP0034_2-20130328/30014_1 /TAXON_ID=156128 /ORGANISM="Nephroselmis pyriformis, Strain CCMP717" /LENGTH=214 /DNA_ID=CAMNT_0025036397 /DNA_START=66 /DNA_END=707 /DNA_ORIENTATION=+
MSAVLATMHDVPTATSRRAGLCLDCGSTRWRAPGSDSAAPCEDCAAYGKGWLLPSPALVDPTNQCDACGDAEGWDTGMIHVCKQCALRIHTYCLIPASWKPTEASWICQGCKGGHAEGSVDGRGKKEAPAGAGAAQRRDKKKAENSQDNDVVDDDDDEEDEQEGEAVATTGSGGLRKPARGGAAQGRPRGKKRAGPRDDGAAPGSPRVDGDPRA